MLFSLAELESLLGKLRKQTNCLFLKIKPIRLGGKESKSFATSPKLRMILETNKASSHFTRCLKVWHALSRSG